MEEENQVNSYLVSEKFPNQLSQMKTKLKYYDEVTSNKALGQTELTNYRAKVKCTRRTFRCLMVSLGILDWRIEFGYQ
jgi:hypothetical protein